jgi:hypothetical protein
MRSIEARLCKLENRLGVSAAGCLLILMDAGRDFGPADDAYIKSLDEARLLPASGFSVVDLGSDGYRTIASRRTQRL